MLQRPLTVLVIDDDELIRLSVSSGLSQAGYEVITAADGRQALQRIAEALPDLIVSDVMMPDMDGLTLLKRLRSEETTRGIPLILLTAQSATHSVVEGLSLGADDYLTKPFEMSELLARVKSKIERPPVPSDRLIRDRQTGLLTSRVFNDEVRRELTRVGRGGAAGCLAYAVVAEWPGIRERFGARAEAEIATQLANLLGREPRPLDLIALGDSPGTFALLLPETEQPLAQHRLETLSQAIAQFTFTAAGEHLRLTPAIGYATYASGTTLEQLQGQALTALEAATGQLDLRPRRYLPAMGWVPGRTPTSAAPARPARENIIPGLTLAGQIALTLALAWVAPFLLYAWLDSIGRDITPVVYIVVVVALAITALLIWIEGLLSLKKVEPPSEPPAAYPPASAIIAAYLPNEAATIVDTIEAFRSIRYPAPLQIILAYNTPQDMPIEGVLRQIARVDPNFLPLRVPNSTSKAQNVNAALAEVRGQLTGIFDADHHPAADCFMRAWKWLAAGYDVVQGHCAVRNGAASWLARLVAVEFEVIYGSSHPGRMRLHDFGIFGGSNGYWKTDLLRATRMQGFMLTEDIDASMRLLLQGKRVLSDPQLLSRELAPTRLAGLWNQRMRWAQGWFQVSLRHLWAGLGSRNLSGRQKLGLFWLLGWREIYPWISIQVIPLVTYWVLRFGGLHRLDWLIPIFVLTTLFTLSVGPGQTLFAYLAAVPEIRARKGWFWNYLLASSVFYAEFRNLIARVAQMKELFRERKWKVTPREE